MAALSYRPADTSRPVLELTTGDLLRQAAADAGEQTALIEVAPPGTPSLSGGVTDLDDILARLAAHGIGHEPVETYGNGVRHVVVLDPDGNSLSLAEAPAQ